jgi:C1A family cysteine protease
MGWQPEIFDPRDYTQDSSEVLDLTRPLFEAVNGTEPEVDLREYFPEAEDQGPLSSSCAFAVLGLIEYFESRYVEVPLAGSRLFLYQMALRLRGTTDDVGSDLRTTLKAVRRFGVPSQRQWPYQPEQCHRAPTDPFLFGFANEFRHIRYLRVNGRSGSSSGKSETLGVLKTALAAQVPFLLGFLVPATLNSDGLVYDLDRSKTIRGGQAVVVVGYDDQIRIASHKGAMLIRNSWGTTWGHHGYGWLPYDLLESPAVGNAWMIVSSKWSNALASQ